MWCPSLKISHTLGNSASKFVLNPFDEVFVRSSPNYELQQFITLQGQVLFPGVYGLEKKDDRLSDLIKRAGGLNKQAYPEGAKLIRTNNNIEVTDKDTYEYQKAGVDAYHSIWYLLRPEFNWDRKNDTGINFYYQK